MTKKSPSPAMEKTEGPPPDIVPLFLATKSQEIFECICDEHVTEENPFKLVRKEDIINDMRARAAVSDFHPVKQIVQDYPAEELLISYDPDFKYGQNFFLCITEEAKNRLLHPEPDRADSAAAGSAAGEEGPGEEETVHVYAPPQPKDWIDQGSLAEVNYERVVDTRPKLLCLTFNFEKDSVKPPSCLVDTWADGSLTRRSKVPSAIRYCASRVRKEFGAPFKFQDRDADPALAAEQGLSASYLSCNPYADQNFNIKKVELDLAVQAVPETADGSSQTDWKHPVNAAVQYEARSISEEERRKVQETDEFNEFITDAAPRFELAMQQNIIIDVFFDDWLVLGEEDTNFGSKSDSHLKEYQSFTDLEYSKDKTISYVDWHPQVKGVMGVACCERYTFDERIDHANRLLMNPSLILIWSFTDPIHPQLVVVTRLLPVDAAPQNLIWAGEAGKKVAISHRSKSGHPITTQVATVHEYPLLLLEGPDDITCFKFCPTNPDIIAGGCVNGQLVLWDMKEHSGRINNSKGGGVNTNQKKTAMFGEEVQPDIPTVRYCAVSSIEGSHRSMIASLQWLPSHLEEEGASEGWRKLVEGDKFHYQSILADEKAEHLLKKASFNRLGVPVENKNNECSQIITCGVDGNVMVWDIRVPKITAPPTGKEQKNTSTPYGVSNIFKHLDLTWKPLLKLSMPKTDSSGDYSPLKLSITERQKPLEYAPPPSSARQEPGTGGIAKLPSGKSQKVLEGVSSRYFIGTEDGEVVYCDFKLEKDNETGKLNVHKPTWSAASHDGPVRSLQRNPFFTDVILSVGGWTFSLWREGMLNSTILQSACAPKTYTAAHWSMTRPAVFFLGTKTGNVEVWDLLDRTHEPVLSQNVTAAQISHIVPCIVSRKQHLLGVADTVGTLHILEIPWNLRQPAANEEQLVLAYLDRETKRIEYFLDLSAKSSSSKPPQSAKKKQPVIKPEEDEAFIEECQGQYDKYLQLENKLLQELGILEEEKADV